MLFCALETFIRERSLECAGLLNQALVPYSKLPEGLKKASLISTFEGLLNNSRQFSPSDQVLLFEQAAVAAASGKLGSAYKFSDYSFGREKSNIVADDIAKIAKAFGVPSFWNVAKSISESVGLAQPAGVDEAFKQLAKERHKSAHVSSHSIAHSTLSAFIPQTLVIALSFDLSISLAVRKLNGSNIVSDGVHPLVSLGDFKYVILRPVAGRWKGFIPGRTTAIFVENDYETAMPRAVQQAAQRVASTIIQDQTERAVNWISII
ncbi:HEPN domain-containing protein [Xanthomonas arboricola]|nr:HEPN domain-containing protein [Xanthomonas arboricola]